MELWKPIPGYEGLYEASNEGRIRTALSKTTSNRRYPKRVWKQRILKPKACGKRKDLRVSLWKDGKQYGFLVARLVAITWCDGFEEGLTVNHIDGDFQNNSARNLEWLTLEENVKHGFRNGMFRSIQIKTILTDKSGKSVSFDSMASASRYLGRNPGYISNSIKSKKKHITSADGSEYFVEVEAHSKK